MKVIKKPNVKLKDGEILPNVNMDDYVKSDSENLSEEEEREVVSGSRSPLLTRSRSLEKMNSKFIQSRSKLETRKIN